MDYLQQRISIFNSLNIDANSIIDYGGGDGRFLEKINIENKYIVDLKRKNYEIDFFYPFEFNKTVDLVFMNMTLHHIEELAENLNHIKNILNNNGKLIIREFDACDEKTINIHYSLDKYYQQRKKLNNFNNYNSKKIWEKLLSKYFKLEKTIIEKDNPLKAYWQVYSKKFD